MRTALKQNWSMADVYITDELDRALRQKQTI